MPQFKLDLGSHEGECLFNTMDEFTQGYVECAFFTECHSDSEDLNEASFAELAPEALASMIEDCHDFQESNSEDLEIYYQTYDESHAGHDFWLTRNRHGAGFWDRGGDDAANQRLTKASHPYGSCGMYRGDNGKIYLY